MPLLYAMMMIHRATQANQPTPFSVLACSYERFARFSFSHIPLSLFFVHHHHHPLTLFTFKCFLSVCAKIHEHQCVLVFNTIFDGKFLEIGLRRII
jgi:hypothetical protein